MTSLVGKIGSGEVPQHELYPRKKNSSWLPYVTKARPRNTILGNGIRLWYSLVCVCGRLENPLQHKHPLLHYVANEKKGILCAKDFKCARFAGGNMFCHANVLLANDIQSTETRWKSTNRAVELHQTLFCRPMTS